MLGLNLDGTNEFSIVGSMLHHQTLTTYQIQRRKFIYIEGLIRFLELYAQNEIGNVELDIQKIALWVNSPSFENVDIYRIKNTQSVYKMLTSDIIEKNVPLYRFLKLSKYQFDIFEKEHHERLLEDFHKDCEKYPCLKCIWYSNEATSFGNLSTCRLPHEKITNKASCVRKGYHDISSSKNKNCKYIVGVSETDKFISEFVINNPNCATFYRNRIIDDIKKYAEQWNEKLQYLDNSYIPLFIPDSVKLNLSEEDDVWKDYGRTYNNKKTKSEMKQNFRFAMFLETMIKFVEVYAQSEVGSDFIADISKIAKFVDKKSHDTSFKFRSEKELYDMLENHMIDDEKFIRKFIKRKE